MEDIALILAEACGQRSLSPDTFYGSIKQRVMWEWILHQDGQARVIKETGQLLWNPPWTVKNNCLWSLYGFRSLGSDFTMLLPGNEESHLCCFCMDSLSFGETQNTLAHTRETLLYWDAARHRSEICCCGIGPHYTHGVRDNIWDTNISFQHNTYFPLFKTHCLKIST